MTNTVTLTYLGREFTEIVLTAEELNRDEIRELGNYHISVQGYELCYNSIRGCHFLATREELAKYALANQ